MRDNQIKCSLSPFLSPFLCVCVRACVSLCVSVSRGSSFCFVQICCPNYSGGSDWCEKDEKVI